MQRLVGGNRKGLIGLVLAILVATGAQSYARSEWNCWASCYGCSVVATNCSSCYAWSESDSCGVTYDGCESAGCGCDGSGDGECFFY